MKLKNRKFKIVQLILLFSIFNFQFSIFNAVAAELRYFESFYDVAGSLTLATAGPSYQYFIPYDDYVSGFDIWVENEGSAGSASFGLRDGNDNLLSAKTINIPYIARTSGGQKLHIEFAQPINVISGQIYKIKMLSSMPKLKIYYSNLVDVQVHNATNDIERQIKPAYIGANEQGFFFKFALYEDGDVSNPLVSNFSVNVISPQKASFRFNANEPVDYKISFWPNGGNIQETNFFNDFNSCDTGFSDCILEIDTLPNTNYNYRLTVKDIWGNEMNIEGNFVSFSDWTQPVATSTPTSTQQIVEEDIALTILNASIVSLTKDSVKVAWTTSKAANSSLLISVNAPGGQTIISIGDATFELEHVLSSGNILRPSTKYVAKIASIDVGGNYVYQDVAFETLSGVSQINEQNQNNENNQQNQDNQQQDNSSQNNLNGNTQQDGQGNYYFNVTWDDYQYSGDGYRIDVFDSNKNFLKRMLISSEKRSAVIEGLSSGKYYAIVYANNNGVLEKIAAPKDFEIPAAKKNPFNRLERFKNYLSGKILYIILFSFLAIVGIIIFYINKRKNGRR